jgi:hypothetical protein
MNFGFLILLALMVLVAAVVLPLILKQIAGSKPTAAAALPYRKKDYLLTAAERSFCHGHDTVSSRATSVALGVSVLCGVVEGQLLVLAKVRLAGRLPRTRHRGVSRG